MPKMLHRIMLVINYCVNTAKQLYHVRRYVYIEIYYFQIVYVTYVLTYNFIMKFMMYMLKCTPTYLSIFVCRCKTSIPISLTYILASSQCNTVYTKTLYILKVCINSGIIVKCASNCLYVM